MLVVLVAIGVGVGLSSLPELPTAAWLLAGPALIVFGFLVMQGPRWCLAGLIVSVVLGYGTSSVAAGSVDLRVPDLFLAALLGWSIYLRTRNGPRGWLNGRFLLALWLVVLGFSLYPLLVSGTIGADAIVGWARLVATFALVWMVPYAIYTRRDVEFALGAVAVAATAGVGWSVLNALAAGDLDVRLRGANGPNTTGLLAAIVLVLALHGPVPRHRALKLLMLVVGISGLLMSRSLGSTAAAILALGVYGVQAARVRREGPRQQLVVPARLLVLIVAGLAVAMFLRPTNLPTSSSFGESTTVHRVVLAHAGLQLFAQDPLLGIGWQRSADEIVSSDINNALHERYGGSVNPEFIPEEGSATDVHNTYVQILAESGLFGFLLFVALVIVMGRGIALVLRTVRHDQRLYIAARAAVVLLVVILIWWNDNTLFGAQPESVLAATFLGILASIPAVARQEGPAALAPTDA